MHKNFDRWNKRKKKINYSKQEITRFQEGEIWWCSAGLNIGHEIDGKHGTFERPFYVIKKCNKSMFIGIPCTTNIKDGPYSFVLNIMEWNFILNFSQVKSISAKRLLRKMVNVPTVSESEIRNKFITYLNRKPAV